MPQDIKDIKNDLILHEKIIRRSINEPHPLRWLPQVFLSKQIYLLAGGRRNPIFSILCAYSISHLLFHYLLPRFLAYYCLDEQRPTIDDKDVYCAIAWLILTLYIIKSHLKKKEYIEKNQRSIYKAHQHVKKRLLEECRGDLSKEDRQLADELLECIEDKRCVSEKASIDEVFGYIRPSDTRRLQSAISTSFWKKKIARAEIEESMLLGTGENRSVTTLIV